MHTINGIIEELEGEIKNLKIDILKGGTTVQDIDDEISALKEKLRKVLNEKDKQVKNNLDKMITIRKRFKELKKARKQKAKSYKKEFKAKKLQREEMEKRLSA